jgi:hypothetical protein
MRQAENQIREIVWVSTWRDDEGEEQKRGHKVTEGPLKY